MQLKAIVDTFFQDGKMIRQEKTQFCESFKEAAKDLVFGRVRQEEYDDGRVMISRTESTKF